jgi:hypothetical protein
MKIWKVTLAGDEQITRLGNRCIFTKLFDRTAGHSFGCVDILRRRDGSEERTDTRSNWAQIIPGLGLYRRTL